MLPRWFCRLRGSRGIGGGSFLRLGDSLLLGALYEGLGLLLHLPIYDCPLDIGVAENQKSGKEYADHNGD